MDLIEQLRLLHDLGPGPEPGNYQLDNDPNDSMLYSSNVFDTPDIINRQMKYLNFLIGEIPLYPLMFIPDRDMNHLAKKFGALRQHGFDGYFIWGWENDLTRESLMESEGIF